MSPFQQILRLGNWAKYFYVILQSKRAHCQRHQPLSLQEHLFHYLRTKHENIHDAIQEGYSLMHSVKNSCETSGKARLLYKVLCGEISESTYSELEKMEMDLARLMDNLSTCVEGQWSQRIDRDCIIAVQMPRFFRFSGKYRHCVSFEKYGRAQCPLGYLCRPPKWYLLFVTERVVDSESTS